MSVAWSSFKLREFEHVLAAPSVAVLRVIGGPPQRTPGLGPRPVLLVHNRQTVQRVVALPSAFVPRGLLRATYLVTLDLLTPSTTFSLELPDGGVLELPPPTAGPARSTPEHEPESPPQADAQLARPLRRPDRRSGLHSKLAELSARLAETEQARGQLDAAAAKATIEATQATDELRTLRYHAEKLEQRLAEADQRAIDAALEIAATQDRAEDLERACQQLEEAREDQREHLRRLEHDVAEAVEARDEMERSVAPLRVAHEQAAQELREARHALRTVTSERDEVSRRDRESATHGEAEVRRLVGELAEAEAKVELLQAHVDTLSERLEPGVASSAAVPAQPAAQDEPTAGKPTAIPYSLSERESIAREAGRVVDLLANTDFLIELVGELSDARVMAEGLKAVANVEPPASEPPDDGALVAAPDEVHELRGQLALARQAEAEARAETIRHAAETEARELAERELAEAGAGGGPADRWGSARSD